jgi:hypothetical protein
MKQASFLRVAGVILLASCGEKSDGGGSNDETPDFTLSLSPKTVTVTPGNVATSQVTITRTKFRDAVPLNLSNAPGGIVGTFSPPAPSGSTSTLTISVDPLVPDGVYSMKVEGSGTPGSRSAPLTVTVGTNSTIDLTVTGLGTPTTGTIGGMLSPTSMTVINQGTVSSGAFRVAFYFSTNSTITLSDVFSGTVCDYPGGLTAGAGDTCNGAVAVPNTLTPGTYYLGVIADDQDQVSESDELNNSRAAGPVTLSGASTIDLTVSALTAPATGVIGGTLTSISMTVENLGSTPTGAFRVGFYYSTDATISTADVYSGMRCGYPAGLNASSSDTCSGPLDIPASLTPGSYYLGAIADDSSTVNESNESNNTRATSSTISLSGSSCSPGGADGDGDRLADCVETNTGIYVSPLNTGTDPNNADTDHDAIRDGDEVLGTVQGLNLPSMGVSPVHRDLLIEYDWFDESIGCGFHSNRPSASAISRLRTAYASAPLANPDGSTGINFIQDYGQGGVFTGGNLIADFDGVIFGEVEGAEFKAHKANNFASNRNGYFHYTILPHFYTAAQGSSGVAELNGDDLIVSMACNLADQFVSGTIMHELGHNLGLRHGGFQDLPNYKPNYNSVMNYKYQFDGVDNNCTPPGNGVLNYSSGTRPPLNESNLDESRGICGSQFGPSVDWNFDGFINFGVFADINIDPSGFGDGFLGVLFDNNDWTSLSLGGLADADGLIANKQVIMCTAPLPDPQRRE